MRTTQDLFDLTGRSALITGGAGHIGSAIAAALAERGAAVAILDRAGAVESAESLADATGVKTYGLAADLADEAAVRAAPQEAAEALGGLDILIHAAAFVGTDGLTGWTTAFEEQDAGTWRAALEVNLTAPVLMTQAALPLLKASGHGSVVMVGSIYGVLGPDWSLYDPADVPGTPAAYAASKGGLLQMTRWLATTLAPAVRVNAIVPGGVERSTAERFKTAYIKRTPMGRMAAEEDFKGAAAFLASDASAYITGQVLMIDGGWSAW